MAILSAALVVALACLAVPARAENRVALVIGNDRYPNLPAERQLHKAVNDAQAVGDTLARLGFQVIRGANLGRQGIIDKLADLTGKLAAGDVVAFFYAGHGVSMGGVNYIVPSDVPPVTDSAEARVRGASLSEADLIAEIQAKNPRVAFLTIDACRDNPFPRPGGRSVGDTRGLADSKPARGVFTIYSAGIGQVALDALEPNDPNRNSVFTRVFIEQLAKPTLDLSSLAIEVRERVAALALTAKDETGQTDPHEQTPAYYDQTLGGRVYLAATPKPGQPPPTVVAVVPPTPAPPPPPPATAAAPLGWIGLSTRRLIDADADKLGAALRGLVVATVAPDSPAAKAGMQPGDVLVRADGRELKELRDVSDLAGNQIGNPVPFTLIRRGQEQSVTVTPIKLDAGPALNNPAAMTVLGNRYASGLGVAQDFVQARKLFEKAAALNHGAAMTSLGVLYENGRGVPVDYAEARKWFGQAAALNEAPAMVNLALVYANGRGVAADYGEARSWYEKAAALNNAFAMNSLGLLHDNGQGVPKDPAQARKWYEQAAAFGNANGLYNIGLQYANGRGVTADYGEARKWYEKAAALNNALAMEALGLLYDNAQGVSKDPAQARQWFEKAAALNNSSALVRLGLIYASGRGVPADYAQARTTYEKAAALNNSVAMNSLGLLYDNGQGVPKDFGQAQQWYEKAAALNNSNAMYNIGLHYAYGHGMPVDFGQARTWYEKAAALNHALAMNGVGSLYDNGQGVAKDYAAARQWYEKAAALNNSSAMYNLGRLYANGLGVARDVGQARDWYQKAANLGHDGAKKALDALK